MAPALDLDCIGCCAGAHDSCELDEARQEGGPPRQIREKDELVARMGPVAARAQTVQRGHARRRGQVAVGGAADAGAAQLEAQLEGNATRLLVQHAGGGRGLERRPVEAARYLDGDASVRGPIRLERDLEPARLILRPDPSIQRERRALGNHVGLAAALGKGGDDQLMFTLRETEQELFRLRFQAATEKLDAPSNLRKLRQEIARIKTVQRQRELAAQPGVAT